MGQAAVPGMVCGPQSHPSPHPRWTWRPCPQHAHDMSWGTGVRETSDVMDRATREAPGRGAVLIMLGSKVHWSLLANWGGLDDWKLGANVVSGRHIIG